MAGADLGSSYYPSENEHDKPPQYPAFELPNQPIQHQPMTANTSTMVTLQQQQPVVFVGGLPPNYSALAWLTCLCCCCPFGIVAIIKSNEVDNAISCGDLDRARAASREAKKWGMIALVAGLFISIGGSIIGGVVAALSAQSS